VDTPRTNLKDLTREELRAYLRERSEPAYRGDQIFEWIYAKGAAGFDAMSNLPKALRARLSAEATLAGPIVEAAPRSSDGTRKLLLRLEDGATVEAVLIPDETRTTLCVSTQVGCPLACKFCATGVLGFSRNLAPHEIVEQFLAGERIAAEDRAAGLVPKPTAEKARRFLSKLGNALDDEADAEADEHVLSEGAPFPGDAAPEPAPAPAGAGPDKPPRAITNMVLMGMGEPLLNFENVVRALTILMDPRGVSFSRHRITLSTVGILPKLWPFLEATGVNLAVSLHAPNPALRGELMPIDRAYPMREILDSIRARQEEMKDRVTFEYVLLDGVNDGPEQAKELAEAIRGIRAKVNLLPFNPYEGAPFARPDDGRVERFKLALRDLGVDAFIRKSRGRDIAAACGQLALRAREADRIVPLTKAHAESPAGSAG
jgi:23S rRNA (adenine2503-C2)-methyltransferase